MTVMLVWWLIIMSFLAVTIRVRCQLDDLGFISIDCGISKNSSYIDDTTDLTYTSDMQFIDTGANYNISKQYISPSLSKRYLTVRSFPNGTRNCYTLRSLSIGWKYLIRATFFYGNYDKLNKLVVFDIYIGVNLWKTVNISQTLYSIMEEIIITIQNDFIQVCLVNTGNGIPFISGLDLRPLKNTLYPMAKGGQSIALYFRINMGPKDNVFVR
ncbi:putative leucine-rich repeat receptor-like serine/threonine-protein kinase At2g19230 [Typha angustifolia]|uniref:putative leucine-rich repeat receptor-like serine/threonine-protein kinase At2g19230 n=1 Tax=Typha angustifolia TaxID=59011 RepID=UPI003C2B5AB4